MTSEKSAKKQHEQAAVVVDSEPADPKDGSASSDDKLMTLSKVWDALTTYERFKLLAILCGLIATVAGGMHALDLLKENAPGVSESEFTSLKSKTETNEKAIEKNKGLVKSQAMRIEAMGNELKTLTTLYPETVTKLEDATPDSITLSEYHEAYIKAINDANPFLQPIKKQIEFNKRFAGRKIQWTAFVISIVPNELSASKKNYVLQLSNVKPDSSESTPAMHAPIAAKYFQKDVALHRVQTEPQSDSFTNLERLTVGESVRFEAVFDGRGGLYRFGLLEINPK